MIEKFINVNSCNTGIKFFIDVLSKHKIDFLGQDRFGNICVRRKDDIWRISDTQFFRINGKAIKVASGKKNEVIIMPLSDIDFYTEVVA